MSNLVENPVFDIATAYRKTAALVAAVKLDVFTAIGSETMSLEELGLKTGASVRGLRMLCDYLSVMGLLKKQNSQYLLTHVARTFLDEASPFAMGKSVDFLAAPEMLDLFLSEPAAYVRRGGSTGLAHISSDNPIWVRFAKAMMPFAGLTAKRVAAHVSTFSDPPYMVLDIAASHGLYGIEIAKAFPEALITAIDWAEVLEVAKANAESAGVADRFRMVAGNALDLDWGGDFDLILLPNFLHHFDFDTCTSLLRKVKANLAAGGQALSVDFVPNEDRVSPAIPVMFAFQMLATTPGGDAYTARELDEMARSAGFRGASTRPLSPIPESLIIFEN
ncbi:MAG TPA: class I SAM-dependent methyltransferase [Burkholderiales bacterium]|nr:class I SAM-dependent methyltransferase [Burkholderiales bacterium]